MKVEFRESFAKDLRKIGEKSVLRKVEQVIKIAERAQGAGEIPGLRKLAGSGNYCRVRIGDYRIGVTLSSSGVTFVRVLQRKEVYRHFP